MIEEKQIDENQEKMIIHQEIERDQILEEQIQKESQEQDEKEKIEDKNTFL